MDEQTATKLDEEIIRIENKLKTMEIGSEEHVKVANLLKGLYQIRVEHAKAEWDYEEKREKRLYDNGRTDEDLRIREEEAKLKCDQSKNEKLLQVIRLALDACKIVGSAILMVLLCLAGFKLEETGSFTSKIFGRVIDIAMRKLSGR